MSEDWTPGCVMHPCPEPGNYFVTLDCDCPDRHLRLRVCARHVADLREGKATMNCCRSTARVAKAVSAG